MASGNLTPWLVLCGRLMRITGLFWQANVLVPLGEKGPLRSPSPTLLIREALLCCWRIMWYVDKIILMGLRDGPCPCGFLLCIWQRATLEMCVMSYGSVNVFLWIFLGQEMKMELYKLHVSYLEGFALRSYYSSSNALNSGKLQTLRRLWPNRRQAGTSLGHS